jgi:hypothetical protein
MIRVTVNSTTAVAEAALNQSINRIPDRGQRASGIELEPNGARKVLDVIDHFVQRSASGTQQTIDAAAALSACWG